MTRAEAAKLAHEASRTHGLSKARDYDIWLAIRYRCTNPNCKGYKDYGGRGIKMCERWLQSPANFFADMGPRPDGYEIERKDNNGDYCPGNCIWALRQQNCRNRRSNVPVEAFGERKIIVEWSEDPRCRISITTLTQRIQRYGWPPEKAITAPVTMWGGNKGRVQRSW